MVLGAGFRELQGDPVSRLGGFERAEAGIVTLMVSPPLHGSILSTFLPWRSPS